MSATIDIGPVVAALNRLVLDNHSTWLVKVGEYEKRKIEQRIRVEKADPDGKEWAPWRPFTREKRIAKGNSGQGLLWDTGHLLASQTYVTPFGADLEIGTDVPYAQHLQEGVPGKMEARPFVGWGEADLAYLETSLVEHLQAMIG